MDRIEELKQKVLDKRWSIDKIFVKAIEELVDGVLISKPTDSIEQRVLALEIASRKQAEAVRELARVLYAIRDWKIT